MAFVASSRSQPPAATTATGPVAELRRLSFPGLGTTCEVQYAVPPDRARGDAFEKAARAWVEAFEAKFSRFRPDSLVSRINRAAGRAWVEIDAEMEQMLSLGDAVHAMTRGVLDATALPLLRLWNWKAERPVIPGETAIADACRLVGWNKLQRLPGRIMLPEPGMALDFGGFGKEYAVDLVAQIAVNHGLAHVLVDFGHDLRALGTAPGKPAWHIGLEDPREPGTTAGSIALGGGKGVASSGDYLRCFTLNGRRYGHIVDPRTGWPVANGCLQATIIADTCLQAGVLSTTAFVLGAKEGLALVQSCPGAEGLLVTDHARVQTRGFVNYVAS